MATTYRPDAESDRPDAFRDTSNTPNKKKSTTNRVVAGGVVLAIAVGSYIAGSNNQETAEAQPQNPVEAPVVPGEIETPIESATPVITAEENKEITAPLENDYRTEHLLIINSSNDEINWDAVFSDELTVEDPSNPVSILEYHALQRFGAICTGDSERLKNQYKINNPSEVDELSRGLGLIEQFRIANNSESYDPYDSYCFDSIAFTYDTRNIREIIWSEENSRLSFIVPVRNITDGSLTDTFYEFIKDEHGHFIADRIDHSVS